MSRYFRTKNADRSALYLHDIFIEADIKKSAPVLPPDITALKAEIAHGVYRGQLLMSSIQKVVYGVNSAWVSSQVDENGEPKASEVAMEEHLQHDQDAEDSAITKYLDRCAKDELDLQKHDAQFNNGHYDGKGACKIREKMAEGGSAGHSPSGSSAETPKPRDSKD